MFHIFNIKALSDVPEYIKKMKFTLTALALCASLVAADQADVEAVKNEGFEYKKIPLTFKDDYKGAAPVKIDGDAIELTLVKNGTEIVSSRASANQEFIRGLVCADVLFSADLAALSGVAASIYMSTSDLADQSKATLSAGKNLYPSKNSVLFYSNINHQNKGDLKTLDLSKTVCAAYQVLGAVEKSFHVGFGKERGDAPAEELKINIYFSIWTDASSQDAGDVSQLKDGTYTAKFSNIQYWEQL